MDEAALSDAQLLAAAGLWKRTGRAIEARFTGTSMEPTIPSGATLRLACGAPATPGDVAALVHDGHLLVHRVVAIRPGLVLTRGDGLVVPDPPLALERVFARVEAVLSGDSWGAPARHADTAAQRLVSALTAFRIAPAWARLAIAVLRRLRPRRDLGAIREPVEDPRDEARAR